MITNEKQTIYSIYSLFGIMAIYEIRKAVRYFVSLLGVLSNAYWFSMTSSGWLCGALLPRYLYLNKQSVRWMKHNFTAKHTDILELTNRILRLEQQLSPVEALYSNSLSRPRSVRKYS